MSRSIASYNATNIAATTAGVALRTGRGILHAIALNTPIATSVITVYDGVSTSGTKLATITVPASPQATTLLYDVAFVTGLFVVMATANSDITVSWCIGG